RAPEGHAEQTHRAVRTRGPAAVGPRRQLGPDRDRRDAQDSQAAVDARRAGVREGRAAHRRGQGRWGEGYQIGYEPGFLAELGEKAGRMWEKLAAFFVPKLASGTVSSPPLDLSKLSDEQLDQLERMYADAAADRGPGAVGEGATQH